MGLTTSMSCKKNLLSSGLCSRSPKKSLSNNQQLRQLSRLKKISLPPTTQQLRSGCRTSSPILYAAVLQDTSPPNVSAVVLAVRVSPMSVLETSWSSSPSNSASMMSLS
jgi:hypothetical protein